MLRRLLIACSSIALLLTMGIAPAAGHQVPSPVNPGFEKDGSAVQSPSGWMTSGSSAADFTAAGGHNGAFRLAHWADVPYRVETTQKLNDLQPGWYTLRVWVERSAGQNDAWIGLRGCGGPSTQTAVPVAPWWVQVVVSTFVTGHSCTIVLHTNAAAAEWTNFDDVEFVAGRASLSILGADVSSLAKSEDLGGVYRWESGRRGDALAILKAHGLNWVRLRVFVNPADGYHGTAELLDICAASEEARPQGSRRPPLLRLLGRSGQAMDTRGMAREDLPRAQADLRRLHARDHAGAQGPGNATRHDSAWERDHPGHVVGLRGDVDRLLDGR